MGLDKLMYVNRASYRVSSKCPPLLLLLLVISNVAFFQIKWELKEKWEPSEHSIDLDFNAFLPNLLFLFLFNYGKI